MLERALERERVKMREKTKTIAKRPKEFQGVESPSRKYVSCVLLDKLDRLLLHHQPETESACGVLTLTTWSWFISFYCEIRGDYEIAKLLIKSCSFINFFLKRITNAKHSIKSHGGKAYIA